MTARPLVIWLYGDIACPWTRLVLGRIRRIQEVYGERVLLGWRPLPIESGPAPVPDGGEGPGNEALRAVEFARDLGGDKADRVLDALFEARFGSKTRLDRREDLLSFCAGLGLDREGLGHALSDGRYDLEFQRAEAEAALYGIEDVPTVIVGKRKLVGAAPIELLDSVVRAALGESGTADH